MNSPFAAPVLLVAGLVFLFGGERLFGDETALRLALDVLGVAGIAGSLVTRGSAASLSEEIKKWIAWIHVGLVVALALYVLQLPAVLGKLGFAAADSEKTARAVIGTLWPIALAISALTALFLDAALIGARRMPQPEVLRIRASAQTGLALGLLVAIFGVGNYLASVHSPEVDLSRRKVGSPTDATMAVAKNLDQVVYANVFFPPSNEVYEEIDPYLRGLESGSGGKVKVLRWDHALDMKVAKRVSARDNGAIFFTRTSPEEGLDEPDPPKLPNEKLQIGLTLDGAKSKLKKFDAEIQKGVLKLVRGSKRLYATAGHGERNLKGGSNVDREDGRGKLSLLNRYLGAKSLEVKVLSAASGLTSEVPSDAGAVVIAGATDPWLDEEIETLKAWFDQGGSLFVFLESGNPDGIPTKLLEHLGVKYEPALVANDRLHLVETRAPGDNALLITNKTTSHSSVTTISRNRERLAVAIPRTGSVAKAEGTQNNVQLVLSAMPGSFRDANGSFLKDESEKADGDKIAFVAAVEGPKKEGKAGKALVVASTELLEDKWLRIEGNIVFVADAVNWLVGEEKYNAPVALDNEDIPIKHTKKEDTVWFYATIFLAPAMVLGGGLGFVHRSRRGRKQAAA